MNIPQTPKPTNPAFLDKVIGQIQDKLIEKIPWLDHAFGRAQKLVRMRDQKEYFFPGVHIESGEYQSVLPNENLGNFSFFVFDDPQNVDFRPQALNNVFAKYAIIFWVNLDDIFQDNVDRNIEEVKAQILKVLTRELFLTTGRIDVRSIYERAENVYKDYSLKEIDSQFITQPFAGFRFEGQMSMWEEC